MRLMIVSIVVIVSLMISACSEQPESPKETSKADAPELILVNAKVYSLSWPEPDSSGIPHSDAPYNNSWSADAEAVAISNGIIQALGNNEDIIKLADESTTIKDLNGATVLPGLIDSHTHIFELGKLLHIVNVTDAANAEQAIEMIRQQTEGKPPGEWIIGRGWDEGAWANNYPTRAELDTAFPDNPVYLLSLHSFAVWANTQALVMAGISKDSKAPVGGEIVRDDSGEPTGILLNRATRLFDEILPKPDVETYKAYFYDAMLEMAKSGFVSVHEAGVDGMMMQALSELHQQQKLPIRMYAMLSARDEALVKERLTIGPVQSEDGFFDVMSVKAYYDGALGSRGARLLEDYSDQEGHRGLSGDSYGFNKDRVDALITAGFQIGIHAIGDAGNREVLAYYAGHMKNDPAVKSARHRVEHAQVVHPDDFKYFTELDLIASMEPPHAVEDKTWAEARLGPERILGAYAWRTFRKNNVPLALNSDMPGSDHSIFYGLYAAVTRQDKSGEPAGGWYIDQALTMEEAIRGYTQWSAYAGFREQQAGTLSDGKWADITVMDIDPFQLARSAPEKILSGKVLMTIVNGRVVFEAGN